MQLRVKGIFWDLDETLLDTSPIKRFRDNRDWKSCKINFHKVKEYPNLLKIFHMLNLKYKTAIISSSPKWYVNELTKLFNINSDIFLGFGDTKRHKPKPEPFLKAMEILNLDPSECLAIGDSIKDFEASLNAKINFIGVSWGESKKQDFLDMGCKVIIKRPNEIFNYINI